MDPHPTAGKGQKDKGRNIRWKIEPEEFVRNYDPRPARRPKVTHLLYEIQWGRRPRIWKNRHNNDFNHAEINFFQNRFNYKCMPNCYITWFLSWTPCGACSHEIIKFLEAYPHVKLEIRAAKLFHCDKEENKNGFRNLAKQGVKISIMHLSDYQYCWRSFVAHKKGEDVYWPLDFFPQIISNDQDLYTVLEDLCK